jgi:hypothetical protein
MPKKWYVHLQGETFGPLSTDLVKLLLKQNRLQFTDFVWTEGLRRWERLIEIEDFVSLLPVYPHLAPPKPEAVPEKADDIRVQSKTSTEKTKAKIPTITADSIPKNESKVTPIKTPKLVQPLIRAAERVPMDGKVVLDGHGTFPVMNISETGLILKSSKGIPVGMEVKFLLEHKGFEKSLSMTGITIREGAYEGAVGIAIQFTRVNPAHKRVLQEYVKSTLSSKAA